MYDRRRLLAGCLLLLLPGCVRLVGRVSSLSETTDGVTVATDRGGIDRKLSLEKEPFSVEAGRDLRRDIPTTTPCGEPRTIQLSSVCAQQGLSCDAKADADCDGLPAPRDPWLACNRLLIAEELDSPPAARWSGNTGGWSCGKLALAANTSISMQPTSLLTDSTYFTEVRFTLGAISATEWSVTVLTAYVPQATGQEHHRYCELWVNPTYQVKPGLHSHLYAVPLVPGCDGGTWTSSTDIPAGDGTTYILQIWGDGTTNRCRLYSGDGSQLVGKVDQTLCSPPTPGTVKISTTGRAATIDYIRVFEY